MARRFENPALSANCASFQGHHALYESPATGLLTPIWKTQKTEGYALASPHSGRRLSDKCVIVANGISNTTLLFIGKVISSLLRYRPPLIALLMQIKCPGNSWSGIRQRKVATERLDAGMFASGIVIIASIRQSCALYEQALLWHTALPADSSSYYAQENSKGETITDKISNDLERHFPG